MPLNWLGGAGAHIECPLVVPMQGAQFLDLYRRRTELFNAAGFDHYCGLTSTTPRVFINTGSIIFDRNDADQCARARTLGKTSDRGRAQTASRRLPRPYFRDGSRRIAIRLQRSCRHAHLRAAQGRARSWRGALARQARHLAEGAAPGERRGRWNAVTPAPAMDRRDVLKLGGAAALALLAPDAVAAAARASSLTPSMIAVADPRYRESLIFAGSLERHGAKVLTLASDRAATWFGAIAPQLPHGLHRLTGLTLELDLFILERLAESSGAHTCYAGLHDWRCRQGVGHTLSGTIDLDPIAGALLNGKEEWVEGLGEALVAAKDGRPAERRLQLKCSAPSGRGPRSFVSWLMRWAV